MSSPKEGASQTDAGGALPTRQANMAELGSDAAQAMHSATPTEVRPDVVADIAAGVDPDARRQMVAEAAYYRFLNHGGQGGTAQDDWNAAEAEVDERLRQQQSSPAGESSVRLH